MAESNLYKDLTSGLEEKGVIDRLNCQVRSEVIKLLKSSDLEGRQRPSRDLNPENFAINELIKEYLEWNGLSNAAEVLSLESGHPKERISRQELEKTLNIETGANAKKVPLLYTMVASMRKSSS